jgi:hypothetical protein
MATLTFEIDSKEVDKIKAVLKALGGRKIKIESDNPYSKLEKRLEEADRERKKGELVTIDLSKDIWESI